MITSKPFIDPEKRIWSGCHVLPERWTIESNAQMTGLVYRWLRDKIIDYRGRDISYKEMDEMARNKPIGAGDTYASLGPEIMDIQKMQIVRPGMFLFPPPANPIVTPIDMGNLTRATLENICYAIRGNCDQLAKVSGKSVKKLNVSGGLTTSKLFTQILADILNIPLSIPKIKEASSLGCGVCAAVGAGFYDNLIEASKEMVSMEKVMPIEENVKKYEEHYRTWLSLYKKLPDLM